MIDDTTTHEFPKELRAGRVYEFTMADDKPFRITYKEGSMTDEQCRASRLCIQEEFYENHWTR